MNDFYGYINNQWINKTIIPSGYDRYNNFQILKKKNNHKIKKIIESLKSDNQIKIIYNQYQKKNDERNLIFIKKIINTINSFNNINDLFEYILKFNYLFVLPLKISIDSDFNDSNRVIPHLYNSGLGLPNRDYYFMKSKKNIREEYKKFIIKYSKLFNIELDEEIIYNLELELAKETYTSVQKRDIDIKNNVIDSKEFKEKYPNLLFYTKICNKEINITNPKYTKKFNNLIKNKLINNWKQYFIFKFILKFYNFINKEIEECYFKFYNKIILGINKMKPLYERSINIINKYLGEQIGKLYVEKYFPIEAKNKCLEMVHFIKKELKFYLKNKSWLEDKTKEKAIKKINKMNIKIGFPDVYEKDYKKLDISKDNCLLENIILIRKFNLDYEYEKIYKKLNKNLWYMNPHEVNAYYAPNYNEIVFPAGILQEPFFSLKQSIAQNFGGIGAIIGHEITHGFDDEGSRYDENGNLNNWWTKKDLTEYNKIINKLKDQYDNYKLKEGKINGELTLGENIADLGGVNISLKALEHYINSYSEKDKEKAYKNFFINYAKIWRCKSTSKSISDHLLIDPHAPPKFRVNGIVINIDKFYDLFPVSKDTFIYPNERIRIWS